MNIELIKQRFKLNEWYAVKQVKKTIGKPATVLELIADVEYKSFSINHISTRCIKIRSWK